MHQSLLLLAKIENNLIADLQDINLKLIIDLKLRQFQELFEQADLILELDLRHKTVHMSRYLADILLNNLFSNAVRHNIKGGKIIIKLSEAALVISNTGKDFELKDNLFERFSKSSESEGMGLGLAITKQICNLYGYEISYDHDEMHTFSILF